MAERRMLAKGIMQEDTMLTLRPQAQLYYIHLMLHADDDGFVDRPVSVRRLLRVPPGAHRVLVEKGYLIPFSDTLVVITHWHAHNRIRKATYTPTKYQHELQMLVKNNNGVYSLCVSSDAKLPQDCVTDDAGLTQKCVTGKGSLVKFSLVKERKEALLRQARELKLPDSFFPFLEEWFAYRQDQTESTVLSTLVQIRRGLEKYGETAVADLIRLSIGKGWKGIFFERLEESQPPGSYGSPEDLYT